MRWGSIYPNRAEHALPLSKPVDPCADLRLDSSMQSRNHVAGCWSRGRTLWYSPRKRPRMNRFGAGPAQRCRQRIDRRPGGDDVIDDRDIHSLEIPRDPERAVHVAVTVRGCQQRLRPRI